MMLLYPGRRVYVKLPWPLSEQAKEAQVLAPAWPDSYLKGLGLHDGWWPNCLIGRTRAEAEWKAERAKELHFSRRSRC